MNQALLSESELAHIAGNLSPGTVIKRTESMARHTTLRVGGPADLYVEPAGEADLAWLLRHCQATGTPFFILGRGSNLLVRDRGIRGVVICLAGPEFTRVEIQGTRITAGAGAKQKTVAVEAKRNGLAGVEFLEGIPGSIGGALRMNAGAMGGETFNAVESVRVMDYAGQISELKPAEMGVSYRCCARLKDRIALRAIFQCRPEPREAIETRMRAYNEKRWSSQPAAPSAGCMFKNPTGIPAGKLIEELGMKGAFVGGAMVSLEHGNFIVNGGTATAQDVLELVGRLRQRAQAERGIELHTEVEIVGEA